jgi:predicted RNA-binding protein YlxR (DUF448 family)
MTDYDLTPATIQELERAAREDARATTRLCIATHTEQPKAALLRFVLSPEGTVTPDAAARLPGRGLWVGCDRAALERAIKKGGFAKAAKRAVHVPPDLPAAVEQGLRRRALEGLGLARRAGALIAGRDKVEQALRQRSAAIAAVIEAADASPREAAKLRALAPGLPVLDDAAAAEMQAACGTPGPLVHGVLLKSGVTEKILADWRRWRAFCGRAALHLPAGWDNQERPARTVSSEGCKSERE